MAAITPGISSLPAKTSKYRINELEAALRGPTVYGDIRKELGIFARFKEIRLIDEAA